MQYNTYHACFGTPCLWLLSNTAYYTIFKHLCLTHLLKNAELTPPLSFQLTGTRRFGEVGELARKKNFPKIFGPERLNDACYQYYVYYSLQAKKMHLLRRVTLLRVAIALQHPKCVWKCYFHVLFSESDIRSTLFLSLIAVLPFLVATCVVGG